MKKILSLLLSICLIIGVTSCAKDEELYDYKYNKTSENMLNFESSDKDFDHFINDYFHRHLRYDEKSIGDTKVGESVVFNKEYEALSLLWFNSGEKGLGEDNRIKLVNDSIDTIPVDDFGYAWSANNHLESPMFTAGSLFAQGWPFPHYGSSQGLSVGYEFNEEQEGWTSNIKNNKCTGGMYSVKAFNEDKVEFVSPDFNTDYLGSPINTLHAPFIHMDLRMVDRVKTGKNTTIKDYYIYYKSKNDQDFSENKKVSYSEFATINNDILGKYSEKTYFPMYLLPDWQNIDKIKIVILPKDSQKLSIDASLNYVRLDYDARHSNNNSIMLSSAKTMYEYTGDRNMLVKNIDRFRMMTLFMLEALNGKTGLIDNGYFMNHNGNGNVIGESVGNGYSDILALPETSMYANIFFLRGIEAMAYLEDAVAYEEIETNKVTIRNPKGKGERIEYKETSKTLKDMADKIKTRMTADISEPTKDENEKYHHSESSGFWDKEKGRFIEGYNSKGEKIDYGFLAFNLEAVACGIPTKEQEKLIMSWANGDRYIEGDKPKGKYGKTFGDPNNTSEFGMYDMEFAPRYSTVKNNSQYIWGWNGGVVGYGEQIQDGGFPMFTSYYDILARNKVNGEDDAFSRLKDIQKWYNKVEVVAKKNGVGESISNKDFYRVYYNEIGVQMQGNNTAGGIGLDYEFVESSLLYASIPHSFFGLHSKEFGVLEVTPKCPSALDYLKMENLLYNDILYDLTIGKNFVSIDSVRGNTKDKKIKVLFPKSNKQMYVNGQKIAKTTIGNNDIVYVPFESCKIEII